MSLLDVYLGQAGVVLHHFEAAMTQQPLQGEHIAATAQVGDGKRVPKAVWMAIADLRHPAQTRDQVSKRITIKAVPVGGE